MRSRPTEQEVNQQRTEILANKGVIVREYDKVLGRLLVSKPNFGTYFSVWDPMDESFTVQMLSSVAIIPA